MISSLMYVIRLTKLCIDLKIPVIENLGVTKVKKLLKADIVHKLIENAGFKRCH